MTSTTNLANPRTPFGSPGQASGPHTPTVAALAVTPAAAALVYAGFDTRQPRDLGSDPSFTFGFEVLRPDTTTPEVFVSELDARLLACDYHAEVITAHDMTSLLEPLYTSAADRDKLECLKELAILWPHRHQTSGPLEPGVLVDTAADLDTSQRDLLKTCAAAGLSSAYLDPTGDTWRTPVTTALACSLLAAGSLGWCSWRTLNIDPLVDAAAAREAR